MILEKTENKITELTNRINGINAWIKENPHITDPNVYEIMDCNIQYAEILAELKQYYEETGYPTIEIEGETKEAGLHNIPRLHPSLEACFMGLYEMDIRRDTEHHPFFNQNEANKMHCALKLTQLNCGYELPKDPNMVRIKRELLCKSMSVPFYIWQVHRNEPEYKYDNETEFNQMKEMFDLYKASSETEKIQFGQEVSALFEKINSNYKYAEPITKTDTSKK